MLDVSIIIHFFFSLIEGDCSKVVLGVNNCHVQKLDGIAYFNTHLERHISYSDFIRVVALNTSSTSNIITGLLSYK